MTCRRNRSEFNEAELHVICCLLDDWCMVYQLISSFVYNQGCNEECATNAILDALISLFREEYIDVECPDEEENSDFKSLGGRKKMMLYKLIKMKMDSNKGYALSEDRYIWIQLSEKGFNALNYLWGEC